MYEFRYLCDGGESVCYVVFRRYTSKCFLFNTQNRLFARIVSKKNKYHKVNTSGPSVPSERKKIEKAKPIQANKAYETALDTQ